MARNVSILPDEAVFADFRNQCLSSDNWQNKYDRRDMHVWIEVPPKGTQGQKIHKLKCRMSIPDVAACTMYDVLHDSEYRKVWDGNMLDSRDIARLSHNADVGYYAWRCPSPLKNRDVVTLRSWKEMDGDYMIVNFSVKHSSYPPKRKLVRAVSIITGYFIRPTGPESCIFIYLSQADPKGSIPNFVVNQASQILAPKVLKTVHKAGQDYPRWKKQNRPNYKPWLNPNESSLPFMDASELSIQRADSLENVDFEDANEDEDAIKAMGGRDGEMD